MSKENVLIVADSVSCPDLLYALGVPLPRVMVYLRVKGRAYVAADEPEAEILRRHAPHVRLVPLETRSATTTHKARKHRGLAAAVSLLVREKGARKLAVPAAFPLGLSRELRRLRVRVKPGPDGLFFPQREFKSSQEVEKIRAALVMAEVGLAEALQALKVSKIGPRGRLLYRGSPLTAEKLRAIIQVAVLQAGGSPERTSVTQGATARAAGSGSVPLRANLPVLIELSPRSAKTGYFGHMSRTLVRGRAGEEVRRWMDALSRAQNLALSSLREAVPSRAVHFTVREFFQLQGVGERCQNGNPVVLPPPLGHGVGLAPEEPPWLDQSSRDLLRPGQVIALRPGLHHERFGTLRLGDVVLMAAQGARTLTRFEKVLEV